MPQNQDIETKVFPFFMVPLQCFRIGECQSWSALVRFTTEFPNKAVGIAPTNTLVNNPLWLEFIPSGTSKKHSYSELATPVNTLH